LCAEAAARHQGWSTPGGGNKLGEISGVDHYFFMIPRIYLGIDFFVWWGLSNFLADFVGYRGFIQFFQVFGDTRGLSDFSPKIPGVYQRVSLLG